MRRSIVVALLALALPAAARANTLTIEFDFGASTLTIGAISIPPDGSFTSAGMSLSVPSLGSTEVLDGPATLRSFRFNGSVDYQLGFITFITGPFTFSQQGTAFGTFNAAGGTAFISQDLRLFFGLSLDCQGGIACLIGNFPITFNGSSTVNGTIPFAINNIATPGAASIMTNITFTLNGTTVIFDVVGTEVMRTVPEPAGIAIIGAGAVGLTAFWWLREGRRRTRD